MSIYTNIFDKNELPIRIAHNEQLASYKLADALYKQLPPASSGQPIVFICIGTDRSTGDSLGPLVGTLLAEKKLGSFFVYGTLNDPIHALNLEEKITEIKDNHANAFIIGIDACLGRMKSVGVVQIGDGPVKPGSGVKKELPPVGEIHITGIVNISGFMEFLVLQNTRLSLVLDMAKTISKGIYQSSLRYRYSESQEEYTSLQERPI
ncbi:spore protease YyaC [Niallia taxi]|uniref:spore protease YyaC n=1 Tax=Niallia taxi TaxID=2499688 RepID=UPI0011A74235|nr:spore protease YyaC [Niallia taxi]MCT2345902.1 spore protease YyaC [Niallia taxi]MDE5053576.1 spore protease YyaC [Niallia taxi]WOD63236.1 spore protease YyaC [Niallia taxi]